MQNDKEEAVTIVSHTADPHKWVVRYADYLYNYAISRVNNVEQARDLVQETFLAALERVDKFQGKSTESTWLTAILKNKIIDIYRRKSQGLTQIKEMIDAEMEQQDFFEQEDGHWTVQHRPQPFGIETDDPVISKEFNYIVQKCMQKLPSLWLSVFTMKHMDDATTEVICAELRVTPSNFWVIIHRAKVNLRACLQKNWI